VHPIFVDVRQDLEAAQREAAMVEQARLRYLEVLRASSDPVERWIHVNAVASGVEKVYSGVERGLLRIVRNIDRHVPEGADWHIVLLRRLANPLPDRRPSVLSPATTQQLNELRAFRHRERNSYVGELEPERVLDIAASLPSAVTAVVADIASFQEVLEGS
jgi:hypothetical protein